MRDDEPMSIDDDDRPRRRRRAAPKRGVPAWAWVLMGAGGLLLACCAGIFAIGFFRGATEKPPTYTKVTADQLADEWKTNPAAAVEKYKTNGVEVSGRLKEIRANVHGQTYLTVVGEKEDPTGFERGSHIFVLDEKAKSGLGRCKVGAKVVVKARAEGTTHDRPWLVADEIEPGE